MSRDLVFGRYSRTDFSFEIEPENCRTAIYIVGSPNMGKSTLLGNLAEQFCEAGEGVLLLDIKGDLAREVAERTRFPERVVYVKMGGIQFPGDDLRYWTFNPFEGHRDSEAAREQIRDAVLESFERMGLAQMATMANIRSTLRNAINIALTLPDPTYLDLLLIVVDQSYQQHLRATQKHIDHITRRHWADLDDKTITPPFARRSEINTSRNRLETLLDNQAFNLAVGQYRSTLRLREWLDAGKMVIVDLGLPLGRETGIDLGNMIMAQLTAETFSRFQKETSRTWRVIVDEFHLFVGTTFAQVIREARSYNVFPVVAHQDRDQLTPPVFSDTPEGHNPLKAAVGHAHVSIQLRPSLEDRVALSALYPPSQVERFYGLKKHQAVIHFFSSLAGSYADETIGLNDWLGDQVPGQLAELQMAAHTHTIAKRELVERNRRRYWDHLDGTANRDTRNSDAAKPRRQPKAPTDPPPEVRPRPSVSQAVSAGPSAESPSSPPRPGVARPPRVVDQRDDAGPALPRPPKRKPNPEE